MIDKNLDKNIDFLTLLLQDDLYKNDEEMIVDECIAFLIGSTQTTS